MHNRSIICAVDRKYTVKDIHRCIHAVMALTAVVLLLLVFAASSLLQVKADEEKYQYNNVDTGYEAVIEDDADIIDESNYSSLLDIMKQITVYGNVMLKTIDTNSTTTESYVRSLYREKYGTDSGTIFIIDMYNRNIWIHSNGKIYSTVTSSYADTITDNVYRYASSKDYYMCAYKVYEQELALLKGRRISQPMKYISNVLLAVVAALIINYGIVRLYLRKKAPSRKDIMKGMERLLIIVRLHTVIRPGHIHQYRQTQAAALLEAHQGARLPVVRQVVEAEVAEATASNITLVLFY